LAASAVSARDLFPIGKVPLLLPTGAAVVSLQGPSPWLGRAGLECVGARGPAAFGAFADGASVSTARRAWIGPD